MTLRPYQAAAVQASLRFLTANQDHHGIVVAPTGSGKSLVIASIVTALPGRCLVFQPTREILEQNATKLMLYGYEPAVYSASVNRREVGAITLATIGTVRKLPDLFADVPYILIDECHLVSSDEGMYKDFLEALTGVRVLGLTATPFRLSTDGFGGAQLKFLTRTRPRVFSELVHYTQIGDLVRDGYLVRPVYQPVPGFSRTELTPNTTGADFTDDSVRRYYNRTGFQDRLRRVVLRLMAVGRRHILVFTRFTDEAEQLRAAIPSVAVVSAHTPDLERRAVIAAFRRGEIPAVANVGVLSIGFDFPELDTVVLARPTRSLGLYMQQVGRVVRPHPAKATAWVVDMVDNLSVFGKVEDLRIDTSGKTGAKWEFRSPRIGALTNTYFDGRQQRRPPGILWRP